MIDPEVMVVIDEVEQFQKSRSDSWNIPRSEGMVLHAIVLAAGCRKLVEVGTSYGFSGLFLASAARANGGVLHTFDIEPRKHEVASKHFARAGLDEVVTLHTGDAARELNVLDDGVEFAFLDAAKPETCDYWKVLEPKLAGRCLITVDNTSTHPEALAEFLELIEQREDFTTADVPIGNGFSLSVRTD